MILGPTSGASGQGVEGVSTPPPPLSAQESNPITMGWMQGFPPPKDRIITQPESVYFSFPRLRWSVCHMRELLPTERISRGLGAPVPLQYLPKQELEDAQRSIDAVKFMPIGGDKAMTWEESFYANYTDGMLILHKGRVVYERYFGCLGDDGEHAAMSMTKSLTGLLAEILIVEGALNESALVSEIIPEIRNSAFATATVRQVMDMTTGLRYSEDYSDPNADIWAYSAAASPFPKPQGYTGPNGYWAYLQQLQPQGRHGEAFHYKTVNSDVLGWIISRVSGKSVTDLASERLWRPMGAEQSAYMTVDGEGVPYAGGGLSAGLRDLGRIGLLMLNEGVINGERLFPAEVVRRIRAGGDPAKFGTAYPALVGGKYSSMWWVYPGDDGIIAARGVYGQTIYVDPSAQMVLVRFASYPRAENPLIDPTSLPAFRAVAAYLKSR
ncbi:serine hydrolase (plasmid) [Roseomonas marmotae]|uniref:Serine hydrolase n=3 Tax=Roseomonas marmotae TaxID=2768161 RepID=A0ABS3KJL0_9PROT|nr:serine hydrolase [Roseomonas marmotae]QTI82013.1 serine hydrolase [Roseomonas marmotae]